MSHEGKILRGMKWHNMRNLDGVLPKPIATDPNKMLEVNYYLEEKAKAEKPTKKERK